MSQEGTSVSLFSEKLNGSKHKYFVYDQELYAIVQALNKWRYYLLIESFILYIDRQTLRYLKNHSKLNQKHMKWVEFMQSYTFLLKHRLSKSNRAIHDLRRRSNLFSTMIMEVIGYE